LKTHWTYTKQSDPNSNLVKKNWVRVNVDLQIAQEFKISFRVNSTIPSTYIALDDISYRSGSCNQSATVSVPTLAPVPPSDLDCNFDSESFCNWITGSNPWSLNDINLVLLPMMPTIDHSKQSPNGRYVYVIHTTQDQKSGLPRRLASMTAKDNANNNGSTCVSLWYYMRTDGLAYFNVTINGSDPLKALTISRFNDRGEKWNLLRFDVNELLFGNQFTISALVTNG
jgi:hypothetical protein